MILARNDQDPFVIHRIYQPVRPIDSPRPISLKIVLERLRLSDALGCVLADVLAEFFDAFDFLRVVFLKVQVIFVCRFGESDIHLKFDMHDFPFLCFLERALKVLTVFLG